MKIWSIQPKSGGPLYIKRNRDQSKFIFIVLLLGSLNFAKSQQLAMDPSKWDLGKHKASFTREDGKDAIKLERGTIWTKLSDFTDGIIEVDLSLTERSFAGICFRGDEHGNAETIYLRIPLSGRDDAIQYTPLFNNEANWQLYPEHQAKYVFPSEGWTHMKITVTGNTAQLYMDTLNKPILTVSNLRTHNRKGKIGFTSLSTETFANLKYTPLPPSVPNPVAMRTEGGLITQYSISQAYSIDKQLKEIEYPSQKLNWKTVSTDEDGLLDISKFYAKENMETYQSRSNDLVWLKQELNSDKPVTRKLNFDFSNRVWIFLNGQIIYHGDHSFQLKGPFYKGSIEKNFISDVIYLPLKKGKNELLIGVSAVANGWGFISKVQ